MTNCVSILSDVRAKTGYSMIHSEFDLDAVKAEVRRRQKESLSKGFSYVVVDTDQNSIVRRTANGVEILKKDFDMFGEANPSIVDSADIPNQNAKDVIGAKITVLSTVIDN